MADLAQLHADLQALVGTTIHDRYEVETLLGAGGMGAVFRARHTGLQRGVALKVLHPQIGRDPSVSKRFDREALSASRLDHPNCVRVTDFGTTENGTKYLVMELLDGGGLDQRIGEPWDPAAAVATIEQVLAGLEHAHHVGVVHRDLKPENIFVTRGFKGEEVVKIVDFGIAKLLDEQGAEKLTRQGVVFGTPRYMSPEQAAGGKIDERTDLYAVGLIFYELLAGHPPFQTDDAGMLLRMQIMAPPPPLPDTIPAELAAIVDKLLEKSKADRYASAREVLDALAGYRANAVAAATAAASSGAMLLGATAAASASAATVEVAPPIAVAPAAASSGAMWQPRPEPAPVISGATVAAPAAVLPTVPPTVPATVPPTVPATTVPVPAAAASGSMRSSATAPSASFVGATVSAHEPANNRTIVLVVVGLLVFLASIGAMATLLGADDEPPGDEPGLPAAAGSPAAEAPARDPGQAADSATPAADPAGLEAAEKPSAKPKRADDKPEKKSDEKKSDEKKSDEKKSDEKSDEKKSDEKKSDETLEEQLREQAEEQLRELTENDPGKGKDGKGPPSDKGKGKGKGKPW